MKCVQTKSYVLEDYDGSAKVQLRVINDEHEGLGIVISPCGDRRDVYLNHQDIKDFANCLFKLTNPEQNHKRKKASK